MSTILLTVTNDASHPGWKQFEKSLVAARVPHRLVLKKDWACYWSKVEALRDYLLGDGKNVEDFVFADAYDSLFLGSWDELLGKLGKPGLFSAEKCCWPDAGLAPRFPACATPWKYLNSGGYYLRRDTFLDMVNKYLALANDQLFFAHRLLEPGSSLRLDTRCEAFQTVAFEEAGDFVLAGKRVLNTRTGSMPHIVHGNGHTPLDKFYALLT